MVVTQTFTHLSITFSNQRFSSCSPAVDVGSVNLTSDSFVEAYLRGISTVLLPVLQLL
jgi:hypothetical protein